VHSGDVQSKCKYLLLNANFSSRVSRKILFMERADRPCASRASLQNDMKKKERAARRASLAPKISSKFLERVTGPPAVAHRRRLESITTMTQFWPLFDHECLLECLSELDERFPEMGHALLLDVIFVFAGCEKRPPREFYLRVAFSIHFHGDGK